MRNHVKKLLNHQRDILSPQARAALQGAMDDIGTAITAGADKAALEKQMENLENSANKWLKPYPNAAWRENIEVLLVALTVAMGIRTFFLQPFKIPTGSMQPTLYGVTSVPDYSQGPESPLANPLDVNFEIPTGWQRVRDWFAGVSYLDVRAEADGPLERIEPPFKFLIFNIVQTIQVGGVEQRIWFPPDYGGSTLDKRAGLYLNPTKVYRKGEEIVRLRIVNGDHLFVDRFTYNFRPPQRGEIIVFETRGIQGLPQDQFYIKRLNGLGGETLSLHQDYEVSNVPGMGTVPVGNLVVNGKQITAATPHYEDVYSFYGAGRYSKVLPFKENHYYGHAMIGNMAPGHEFTVAQHRLFVMGDNTMNSLDSRYWGDFPETHVIGRSFFVYWPITERFGWGYH